MKKKIYYIYNQQTLSYERIYPSFRKKLLIIFRNLIGGVILGAGLFWALFQYVLNSPKEMELQKENTLMREQYNLLNKHFDNVSEVLKDIQQRDDNMYRAIFHADPIPSSIRNSGIGGVGRYDYLSLIKDPDLIIKTSQKMDVLSKQAYVQSKSFDELLAIMKQQKDRLLHMPSIQPVANEDLKRMASGYGWRIDPIYGTKEFHPGMDFAAETGTPAYATAEGVVEFADWKTGYGNCLMINHGYGYETLFGHLSKIIVKVGDKVARGQKVAEVGSTGKSTGPHLHYEVRVNGHIDNPANYYFQDLTPAEYDQMLRMAANHGRTMD